MECYSEQIVAIFVDGELAVEEARRLRDHLATCRRCRQLLDALRAENTVLSESLQELPEEATSRAGFTRLPRSLRWGDVVVVAALLALGSNVAVWINELSIPEALQWINPFSVSGRTNLFFTRIGNRILLGGTIPSASAHVPSFGDDAAVAKPDLDELSGVEQATGVFSRFLEAHSGQSGDTTPPILAAPATK